MIPTTEWFCLTVTNMYLFVLFLYPMRLTVTTMYLLELFLQGTYLAEYLVKGAAPHGITAVDTQRGRWTEGHYQVSCHGGLSSHHDCGWPAYESKPTAAVAASLLHCEEGGTFIAPINCPENKDPNRMSGVHPVRVFVFCTIYWRIEGCSHCSSWLSTTPLISAVVAQSIKTNQ
jgi:hypothetical protein